MSVPPFCLPFIKENKSADKQALGTHIGILTDACAVDNPENGVTNIGESAFESCIGLTNVTTPDSLTGIGAAAPAVVQALEGAAVPAVAQALVETAVPEARDQAQQGLLPVRSPQKGHGSMTVSDGGLKSRMAHGLSIPGISFLIWECWNGTILTKMDTWS